MEPFPPARSHLALVCDDYYDSDNELGKGEKIQITSDEARCLQKLQILGNHDLLRASTSESEEEWEEDEEEDDEGDDEEERDEEDDDYYEMNEVFDRWLEDIVGARSAVIQPEVDIFELEHPTLKTLVMSSEPETSDMIYPTLEALVEASEPDFTHVITTTDPSSFYKFWNSRPTEELIRAQWITDRQNSIAQAARRAYESTIESSEVEYPTLRSLVEASDADIPAQSTRQPAPKVSLRPIDWKQSPTGFQIDRSISPLTLEPRTISDRMRDVLIQPKDRPERPRSISDE